MDKSSIRVRMSAVLCLIAAFLAMVAAPVRADEPVIVRMVTSAVEDLGLQEAGDRGLVQNAGATFALTYGSLLNANPQAKAAFNLAAARWAAVLGDDVTIHLTLDLDSTLGANVLGSTSSAKYYWGYTEIRDMMVANAGEVNNAREAVLLPNLPTAAQFSAKVPTGWGLDGYMSFTLANYHALGGTELLTASDGTIKFSSNFAWDYDPSDGIDADKYDFVGVAMHEMGHALGFISHVDWVDYMFTTTNPDYRFIEPTPLDFFRFAAADVAASGFDFTTTARYLAPGGEQVFYFGDGIAELSTGSDYGDGWQASHWKMGSMTNLMEPAVAAGHLMTISPQDLIAMDLIGWQIIPEPATLSLLVAAAMVLLRRRRRV
ncbi:MAG: NF038122 family metalloprotease [Planctomycetaceae bacterium]|nr:NF038122 family metalloprotease [Planctomycetaceae bacterium]